MLIKTKICTKCNKEQSLTEYHKNKQGKDGRQPRCRTCLHTAQREYRKSNGYGASIKYRYGITLDDYNRMLMEQQNKCVLCSIEFESIPGRLSKPVIDHNHSTGKVRALICHPCNVSLGLVKENPETLLKMVEYLKCS